MYTQGGALLLHFTQAFIEHILIAMIHLYVTFLVGYPWYCQELVSAHGDSPLPHRLCIHNSGVWGRGEIA